MPRAFRFIVSMPRLAEPVARWHAELRRVEDLGYASVAVSDHFTQGWAMEPLVTLAAAACATSRLRLMTLVLGNDYRHPVLVHKAAATIDVLSGGRVEIGLGAGWMRSDYDAAGLPYEAPAVRVGRLEEAVAVVKGLFGPSPLSFDGDHYRITGLDGLPKPVQRPHPPILVGGGGRRVLGLAGRVADVAGIYANLRRGALDVHPVTDLSPARVAEKVAAVREAAAGAGRDTNAVELQISLLRCRVTASERQARDEVAAAASAWGVPAEAVAASPAVLVGTPTRCAELLEERRERYGLSCVHVGSDAEGAAPLTGLLAGR